MAEQLFKGNEFKQQQKLEEEKKIQLRQEQADLLDQQMMKQSMTDSPNVLENSMLMSQRNDLSEAVNAHRDMPETGIDSAMVSKEFKVETATSKVRTDLLKKQAGIAGQDRADYINEYKTFKKNLNDDQ